MNKIMKNLLKTRISNDAMPKAKQTKNPVIMKRKTVIWASLYFTLGIPARPVDSGLSFHCRGPGDPWSQGMWHDPKILNLKVNK